MDFQRCLVLKLHATTVTVHLETGISRFCQAKLESCLLYKTAQILHHAGRLVQMAILAELHPCSCSNFTTKAAFGSVLLFKAAFWCSVCLFHQEGICRLLQGRIQNFFFFERNTTSIICH